MSFLDDTYCQLCERYAYEYNLSDLFSLYRKAIDPEMQDLAKELRDRYII